MQPNITLGTLALATEQQVFEHIVGHLRKQGVQAREVSKKVSGGQCKYRTEAGLSCAGGCLISDEEYNPAMEGRRWMGLITDRVVPNLHSQLICGMQEVHDSFPTSEWEEGFRREAVFCGLEYKAPELNTEVKQ